MQVIIEALQIDDEKEIDEEKLQELYENFLNYQEQQEDKLELSKLQQGDCLIQFYLLKLEKRLIILSKTYEETAWNGNESIKLIEKQDLGIINILKCLIAIIERLIEMFNQNQKGIQLEAEKVNSLIQLLLYCDNLEINYLLIKFLYLVSQNICIKNFSNYTLLEYYYCFFINNWRLRYPYIGEIFKNEKFYKVKFIQYIKQQLKQQDTGMKPIGNDTLQDFVFYEIQDKQNIKVDIHSVKKEFTDFFSSYNQSQQIFIKENIHNPKCFSQDFINVMLSLRVAKNISAIKNRVLISLIQSYIIASSSLFQRCSEYLNNVQIAKDYRLIYSFKNFPYVEYQMDILNALSNYLQKDSIFYNFNEEIQLEYEIKFLDDFKSKFLNEEVYFIENVKLEDVYKYYIQFGKIYGYIQSQIIQKIEEKTINNIHKIEQEAYEIILNIDKYISIGIRKIINEIQQENNQNINLIKLFNSIQNFVQNNFAYINQQQYDNEIIYSLKELYELFSQKKDDENKFFLYLDLSNFALLEKLNEFVSEKNFFDTLISNYINNQFNLQQKILFYHSEQLKNTYIEDQERFYSLVKAIVDFLETNNSQLQEQYSFQNNILGQFLEKYRNQSQYDEFFDKINYVRFTFGTYKNEAIDNETLSIFSGRIIEFFSQYLENKQQIIEQDRNLEQEIFGKILINYKKNPYVKSYNESLLAINAFRSSQFLASFYQNLIYILSHVFIYKYIYIQKYILQNLGFQFTR
ncbi:hypothetical protein IMG5_100250 [Ichthyophthirius multifiliis]|uniref:Uncharacterized protein n=1 Tax=Ichthyophthirius multifiliis TaxID=5932 RepID=G0QSC9_ICHMU|nr:hypothetical protein IMG5_100250 [Ichthyophthirius multifiliis]EGR31876.1 hypothetical protein IMG5_100250 [Ichthyophthirius multifiliis]|eukprot:XP_004035362.1 hypothetical protein IMG5_100250 [Ichthyophthirius multifiliis]